MLQDKWLFDTNQDWEVLEDEFESVSLETIPDMTLQVLGFDSSPLHYFEERAPRFVDFTNKPELAIEPEDDNQPITDFQDEKAKKRLERAAKKKKRRNNLYIHI